MDITGILLTFVFSYIFDTLRGGVADSCLSTLPQVGLHLVAIYLNDQCILIK